MIDMLEIPVLGREEDAADFFSIYLLMQFPARGRAAPVPGRRVHHGERGARGPLRGNAAADVRRAARMNAQRHYNVLCLAYGADPALFGDALPAGLPPWRARYCARGVDDAQALVRKLIPAACRRGQAARRDCAACASTGARSRPRRRAWTSRRWGIEGGGVVPFRARAIFDTIFGDAIDRSKKIVGRFDATAAGRRPVREWLARTVQG